MQPARLMLTQGLQEDKRDAVGAILPHDVTYDDQDRFDIIREESHYGRDEKTRHIVRGHGRRLDQIEHRLDLVELQSKIF